MVELFNIIGGLVCHQLPERTIAVGGAFLPVCARCTGTYSAAFLAGIFLFLNGRRKANKPMDLISTFFLCASLLPLMIDGAGSYVGLWRSNNLLRVVSGALFGYVPPILVILASNFNPYGENKEPIVKSLWECILIASLCIIIALWIYLGAFGMYFICSFIICAGIFIMYIGLFRLLYSLFKDVRKK